MKKLTDKLKNKKKLSLLIVILLVGLVLGYWLRGEVPIDSQSNAIAETASAERDGDDADPDANEQPCVVRRTWNRPLVVHGGAGVRHKLLGVH